MSIGEALSGMIRIVAWGIFAVSAILVAVGAIAVLLGSATGSGLMIDNGWKMIGAGAVLFVITLIAWVLVKMSE